MFHRKTRTRSPRDSSSANLRFAAQIAHHPLPMLALSLCMTVGCLGPKRNDYQSAQAISLAKGSVESDALWIAIQDTLRQNRFRLDQVDRREGVITTMSVSSQHWFEFWRHDVNSRPDLWESTVNPMRRWVQARVTRNSQGEDSELTISVYKQRFSSPDRQFNYSAAAYEFFGLSLPATTGDAIITDDRNQWLDVGQDPAMEDYLLHKTLERMRTDHPKPSP